ncbi:MAG: sulfatase-like hydrolase/transferase, partial [Rhizobiaceae bacterium]|nr:sulfatase-like hydrolase/transferase [Rhizobiaceae bacterium]
ALLTGAAATIVRLAGVSAATAMVGGAQAAGKRPPNVLFILADDLGWADVGFHGSDIKTPNLDRLAETGARLEEFYVQPMCTPTRAAFMTGRYPMRYGLQTAVIPSGGTYGLATDEWLLPQALKEAGYATNLVGKWHLGHADQKYWPHNRGFEFTYGPLIGEIDHFEHSSHGVKDWFRNGEPLSEEGYDTNLFGAEAVRVIEQHDPEKPLFLYLAFTAPHTPYQSPEAYQALYPEIADPQRRAYAGMITAMDEEIGNVLKALESRGMLEDTLIFFMSDNGGTRSKIFAGEGAVAGELPPNNGPYRDGKGTLYEGGTRVVALANWPGRIKPGIVNEMMHIVDIYPTIAGLADASLEKTKPLDGMDVWASISEGAASPRDEIVYNIEPFRAGVRRGDDKLVWVPLLPARVELYDLAKDIGETTNVADANAEKVAELQQRILELSKQAQPPLFLSEMVRLGLTASPAFPDGDMSLVGAGAD